MAMNPRLLRPRASGAFTPKSIANLLVWIDFSDASTVTLDGSSKISAVSDKSGNGYNGSQTTANNRLGISTLNGKQCADNGTSSNALSVLYSHGANTFNPRDGFVAGIWDAGGTTYPSYNAFASAVSAAGSGAGAYVHGTINTANLYEGTIWHQTGGSSSQFNNTAVANGGTLNAFNHITSTFVYRGYATADLGVNGWSIGGDRNNAGRGWRGRIGEVIIYSRQLSSDEALKVRKYLAAKWGAPTQT